MNNNPAAARVVLVTEDTALERLQYEADGTDLLLRRDVAVVPYPPPDTHELATLLDQQGLLRPGLMLVQSPFHPSRYAPADEALERFALEKHFAFTTFAAHLGATLVKVEQVDAKIETYERIAKVKGRNPTGVSADVKLEQELSDHLRQRLTLEDRFEGGETDFDAAEKLLNEKRLRGDWNMVSLLEARKAKNRIKQRIVTLSLTQESKSNLRVAASVTVPAYVNLDADMKQSINRKIEYRLTLRVEF